MRDSFDPVPHQVQMMGTNVTDTCLQSGKPGFQFLSGVTGFIFTDSMQPIVISGSAFVSTSEAETHKIPGGEGYMQDLLGPEE